MQILLFRLKILVFKLTRFRLIYQHEESACHGRNFNTINAMQTVTQGNLAIFIKNMIHATCTTVIHVSSVLFFQIQIIYKYTMQSKTSCTWNKLLNLYLQKAFLNAQNHLACEQYWIHQAFWMLSTPVQMLEHCKQTKLIIDQNIEVEAIHLVKIPL